MGFVQNISASHGAFTPAGILQKHDDASKSANSIDKAALASKVEAFVLSTGVAIARLQKALATNPSAPGLSELMNAYQMLQQSAQGILFSLDEGNVHCISALSTLQGSLNSDLQLALQLLHKTDDAKAQNELWELQKNQKPIDPELQRRINESPLIAPLNKKIGELDDASKNGADIGKTIKDVNERIDEMPDILGAAAHVAAGNHTAAQNTMENAVQAMAAKALKEEEVLREVLTEEAILSRREVVKAAIRERAARMSEWAKKTSVKMRDSYDSGIKYLLEEYVGPSVQKLKADLPAAKARLSADMQGFYARAEAFAEGLDHHMERVGTALRERHANPQNPYPDQVLKTLETERDGAYAGHMEKVREAVTARDKLVEQRDAISALLSGEKDNVRAVARKFGLDEKELRTQVIAFREENGIKALHPNKIMDAINEGIDRLSGRSGKGRDGPGGSFNA